MNEIQPRRSDDDLIRSVLAGETSDFEPLIERYGAKLVHFVQRMIQDRDEAENLSQETFVKVYEHLPYYRAENNFSAFLFRIAKNLTLNHIKRQKRLTFFSSLTGHELEQREFLQHREPAEPLEEDRRQSSLETALRSIPEEQRLALILKVYMEMSYKEIATVTGWSIPKIETLISRAKSGIRKKISLQEKEKTDV